MGEEHEVFIESSVGGYHAYFVNASVAIGEVLTCERDHDNVSLRASSPIWASEASLARTRE